MSKDKLEQQLLLDAQEAGFTIINGLIYSASACERMEALAKFAMIRENRIIESLVVPAQTAASATTSKSL